MSKPKERILKHVAKYSDGNLTNLKTPMPINSREQVFKYERF